MSDSIVIIPTYNEKENIENIIRSVFALEKDFHILVIDDGSPDGTASIVHRLKKMSLETGFYRRKKGKMGLGTAYIHGFKWALARSYDYILRWMQIFLIIPMTFPDYMLPAARRGMMYL